MGLGERLKNAWNAFRDRNPTEEFENSTVRYSNTFSTRPDRMHFAQGSDKTLTATIYNRIAVDAAQISLKHCRVDENDIFIENVNDELNDVISVRANIDQTARAFIQDAVQSLCDEGCIAIVPTRTSSDPAKSFSFKIGELRTGKIVQWKPNTITVNAYNGETGNFEDILCYKRVTAIIENPFFTIMNANNALAKRINRKLALLDHIDELNGSGKLDLIIQLPYTVKTELRKQQANQRRQEIIDQLTNSQYGIAYTDGSEHITQLNRAVENNMLPTIEFLEKDLMSQLGITKEILDGTATPDVMNNYYSRIIEPILSAIVDEMTYKFISPTARTQGHIIKFFRKPFKLMPLSELANAGDALIRNQILTSNEFRQIMGYEPSSDPNADMLSNPNMPNNGAAETSEASAESQEESSMIDETGNAVNEMLDDLLKQIDDIVGGADAENNEDEE